MISQEFIKFSQVCYPQQGKVLVYIHYREVHVLLVWLILFGLGSWKSRLHINIHPQWMNKKGKGQTIYSHFKLVTYANNTETINAQR